MPDIYRYDNTRVISSFVLLANESVMNFEKTRTLLK